MPLLQSTPAGLYCPAGDFHIDSRSPVDRVICTHAHSDHARPGSSRYLCADEGLSLLRHRIGPSPAIDGVAFGVRMNIGDAVVSLHPAGHVRGSAQVRIEVAGRVVVVAGDYKRQSDPTCTPFEVVPCDEFITESTFGLPVYRWREPGEILGEINDWWRANVAAGEASILFAYTLGKAQRLLAGLDPGIGPILLHAAVDEMVELYRAGGVSLPPTQRLTADSAAAARGKGILIVPPAAEESALLRKAGPASTGVASGWMQVRGQRRRRSVDRGFVLSDHADWPAILRTVRETGATRIGVTHGYTQPVAKYLNETGIEAYALTAAADRQPDAE